MAAASVTDDVADETIEVPEMIVDATTEVTLVNELATDSLAVLSLQWLSQKTKWWGLMMADLLDD